MLIFMTKFWLIVNFDPFSANLAFQRPFHKKNEDILDFLKNLSILAPVCYYVILVRSNFNTVPRLFSSSCLI